MKHLWRAVLTLVMLTGPAYAQFNTNNTEKDPLQLQYEEQQRARQENERAYNEAMKRSRGQTPAQVQSDPWGKIRPAEQPKPRR